MPIEDVRSQLYNIHYDAYAKSIPKIVKIYLIAIGIIVILNGFKYLSVKIGLLSLSFDLNFDLANSVIISLLCTTTANVLGLMYIVANHLFPKKPKAE